MLCQSCQACFISIPGNFRERARARAVPENVPISRNFFGTDTASGSFTILPPPYAAAAKPPREILLIV